MKAVKWLPLFLILAICYLIPQNLTGQITLRNPNHAIGVVTGNYNFSYNQTPTDQIWEIYPPSYGSGNSGLSYIWESSPTPLGPFSPMPVNGGPSNYASSYTFLQPLTQTTYIRRRSLKNFMLVNISNTIKINVVSVNWEDKNYIREHDVTTTGVTTWQAVDQLPIGQKFQTTTYMDGLGRPTEKVSRETATPSQPNGLWGDVVQFSDYDAYGREPLQYLPYTTTTQSGKFKTTPITEQTQYYTATYNETSAYASVTFDNSPLNRVTNVKSTGTAWAAGAGNSAIYDVNTEADDVKIFEAVPTAIGPSYMGTYPEKTLYKITHIDENGKKVVEFTNKQGQLILRKIQLDDVPSAAHSGWICTYSVYDDFGLLRFELQPEAVKYMDNNNWAWTANMPQVMDELCFKYEYDEKGRTIWKKAPGAQPLRMIYDNRDRVVFMQDGNQAAQSTPEWTTVLYDVIDRSIITTLYHTTKSIAALQADINNAGAGTVTVNNPDQPLSHLVVNNRVTTIPRYAAQQSIEFIDGFESEINDNFIAEIDPTTIQQSIVSSETYGNPISQADLNNPSINTIIKYQFYDNYSFTGVQPFDNSVENTTAYSNSDPNVMPIATTKRTTNFSTGTLVRILGTNTFLASTNYYDDEGNVIQRIEDNMKSGRDVTTLQYHFDGKVLSSHSKHTTAGSGYAGFSTLTKYLFDKIGRVTSIDKKFGSNPFKTIASYEFDDVGRLKNKRLDPGYTGSGKNELENLAYNYNIRGNIIGINKDYALKTSGTYNKWNNFFGLYLGFDNRDGVFANAQLNGQVTGLLWNTQGDDAQRKYDYTYDNAGRLVNALFNERATTADSWSNTQMDFSVSGAGGKIQYDLNGNLLSMSQKGVVPGQAPVNVDALQYTYASLSNKLLKVVDNSTMGSNNGKFGDFKDGANGGTDDYVYDANGNLVIDLNKNAKDLNNVAGANGIKYNFLDKPEEIRIAGKGHIKIVYTAEGEKLQKIFTPEGGGTAVTTTYVNEFVYQGDALQYINFEEGRLRVIQPVAQDNGYDALLVDGNMSLPNSKEGVYDFFIRDYQQNVRMILTEETHFGSNQASMETERATSEEPIFGQTGSANEVVQTRFAVSGIPGQTTGGGWQHPDIGAQVSRLSAAIAKKTGPNSLLKVMAGDKITASTQYYYQNAVSNTTGSTLVNDVLTTLIQAITGSGATDAVMKGAAPNISGQLNANLPFKNAVAPDENNPNGNNPKAYLTVLFFDERFNYVGENSTSLRVTQANVSNASLTIPNVKAPKNGYCFVYLSNESNEYVYFDNLQVAHERGRIVEENHYYSYGLKIAAISSRKMADANHEGYIDNKNLYNDKELFDDADLNWYDYGFRNYDPQIGRFPQLDPLTFAYPFYTPYQYAGCEPIANIDLDGLEPVGVVLPEVIVKVTPAAASQGASVLKVASQAAGTLTTLTMVTYNAYTNSRGQNFLEKDVFGSTPASSQNYLGEEWTYSGKKVSWEQAPYSGPTISAAKPKEPGIIARLYNYFTSPGVMATNPNLAFAANAINDVYVGGSTLIAVGSDKLRVTDLGGNPTTRDQRYWAGLTTLTSVATAGLGSLEGTAAKSGQTIIGEGMKRVSVEAAKRPGSVILNNMPKFTGNAQQVTSQMMGYNRQWILQQMRSGRPIVDIGLDAARTNPSIFYQMEQNMIRNYLKLHPNAFKIIKP